MKKYKLLLFVLVISACQQTAKKVPEKPIKPQQSKVELFLNSFLKNHPHINENDLYYEKAQADFKKKSVAFITDSSGLAAIPLELISTQKNPNGIGYITHFKNISPYGSRLIDKIHIDIFAMSDEKTALGYKKNKGYKLKNYKKVKSLSSEMIQYFTGDMIWTDKAKIDTREYSEDISFGNYALEL